MSDSKCRSGWSSEWPPGNVAASVQLPTRPHWAVASSAADRAQVSAMGQRYRMARLVRVLWCRSELHTRSTLRKVRSDTTVGLRVPQLSGIVLAAYLPWDLGTLLGTFWADLLDIDPEQG